MAHNYILQVTAGPSYDSKSHKVVAVNTAEPLSISSDAIDIQLNVRVQNYRGLPKDSPSTSPYFSTAPHDKNGDQYSISFSFTPKQSINADHLIFGNDFDHPIRDRLPPGFGTAFKIVKWAIDPGLDGDVYADKPYLYGPLGSSINTLRVGSKNGNETQHLEKGDAGFVFSEGGDGDGEELRKEIGVPESEAARKKWFLNQTNRTTWDFEAGRIHWGDFFNPYLDFNEFALRLPGFTLSIMKYWDGQPLRPGPEIKRSHALRYTLKNRQTDQVYMVVVFTLYLKEDVDENGNIKQGVVGGQPTVKAPGDEEEEENDKAKTRPGTTTQVNTNEDDVD